MNDKIKPQNKYFARKFTEELERWKHKDKRNSQELFAELIGVKSKNSITNYKNGTQFPEEKTLQKICVVLNVEPDIFFPQTIEDKIIYDEAFYNTLVEEELALELQAVKEHDINVSFYTMLLTASFFKDNFPYAYQPKETYEETCKDIAASQTYRGYVTSNGLKAIISDQDLVYIKHLEEEVYSFIQYQFYKANTQRTQENLK